MTTLLEKLVTPTGHLRNAPMDKTPNLGFRNGRLVRGYRFMPVIAGAASPNWADAVYDGALNIIADNATRVDVDTTEPTNYSQATTTGTYSVGNYTLTAGSGNGDWLVDDGATDGRELNLLAQSGNNGTATGAANFVAFTDGSSTLYGVIDGDGDTVNSGSPFTIAATIVLTIRDAT